jgi:hypothetical protein
VSAARSFETITVYESGKVTDILSTLVRRRVHGRGNAFTHLLNIALHSIPLLRRDDNPARFRDRDGRLRVRIARVYGSGRQQEQLFE